MRERATQLNSIPGASKTAVHWKKGMHFIECTRDYKFIMFAYRLGMIYKKM